MIGPFDKGHWTARGCDRSFQNLASGRRYAVVAPFSDFDGDLHPIGEDWTFVGAAFLPYDDGQSLFVSLDGAREWHIRLQWRPDQQGEILDHFDRYVQPAPTSRA